MGWTEEDYKTAIKAFWEQSAKGRLQGECTRAALDAVAHRLPRFPAVTDEQAKAIYERYLKLSWPVSNARGPVPAIRDAINEVMGGLASTTEDEMRARIAELEGEVAKREPGPFVLSDEENRAFDAIFDFCEEVHGSYIEICKAAIARAQYTLGPWPSPSDEWAELAARDARIAELESELRPRPPKPSEPAGDFLTYEVRCVVEEIRCAHSNERSHYELELGDMGTLLAELDRIAPKPAAPVSPLDELVAEMDGHIDSPYDDPFDSGYQTATNRWLKRLREAIAAERRAK